MKPATYKKLLKDLQKLQKRLVTAYEAEVRSAPQRMAWMTERWKAAEVGGRVDTYLDVCVRRSAVQLLLRTVYVRVLEDLGTLDPPRIRGQWGFAAFKEVAPSLGIRGYLRWVFRDLAKDFPALFTPGLDELPLPDEDLLREIWDLWHREDGKGALVYDWQAVQGQPASFDSRFLGDLYQDLDREVRKRFALLQTPVFVEEYILDHTLTPALVEFDPAELRGRGETFRLIDPTCGSGHFLIGAFHRLADWWRDKHGLGEWSAASRALKSVWGADLNPHAVDIARFRLLLEVRARTGQSSLEKLASVPLNLAVMDSLIPWERLQQQPELFPEHGRLTKYATTQERTANAAFLSRGFHVIVGNPPYISPRDPRKRDDYRSFWPDSVGGRYPLSVPFVERLMAMGIPDAYWGQITANSFMKREFGKKLVSRCLPKWDLTAIVDTSHAAIPGHGYQGGTATVILFGRSRAPVKKKVWAVLGKRGQRGKIEEPATARVWQEIATASRQPDDQSPYISVTFLERAALAVHPWALGGQIALQLQSAIESGSDTVSDVGGRVGHMTALIEDEIYLGPPPAVRRDSCCRVIGLIEGGVVRDWSLGTVALIPFPYEPGTKDMIELNSASPTLRHFARFRAHLLERVGAGYVKVRHRGNLFYEFPFYSPESTAGMGVVYPTVATHNHYVLVRDGALVKQSAPMVRLGDRAKENDYLDLVGLLNSSVHGFWSRMVTQPKGQAAELWMDRFERDTKKIAASPLTKVDRTRRIALVRSLVVAATKRATYLPEPILRGAWAPDTLAPALAEARSHHAQLTQQLVALQEELDWLTYESYGLLEEVEVVPPDQVEPLSPGHRPFEILAARVDEVAPPDEKSAWWDRHGHPKVTEIPDHYSTAHHARIQARMALIEDDDKLRLLESFPFKRRWQLPDPDKETTKAAEAWLLDRLEGLYAEGGALTTPRPYRLEEIVTAWTRDPRVAAAAAVYEGTSDVDLTLVAERLLVAKSLPDNPHRLYATSGLRKLDQWKEVWALQDREDAGENVGTIPKPPEFKAEDFARKEYFSSRGKLNVPRERFIAFQDLSPTRYGWNGWRDLDRGLAQVEAFTEAEGDAYNPLPPPTHDDPRRCGVTLGLWESLDDVRRWSGSDHHIELQALAQEACRQEACPCDVVNRWQRWIDGEIEVTNGAAEEVLEVTLEDRAFLAQLLVQYGVTGASAMELLRALGWSAQRVQLVLDDLVATGSVGKSGRGVRTMYALPESALPQQKLF